MITSNVRVLIAKKEQTERIRLSCQEISNLHRRLVDVLHHQSSLLHARIWLRGWSDALVHEAFAQAVEWDDELPF